MKKYIIYINVFISFIFIVSLITLIIISPIISDNLDAYSIMINNPSIETNEELELELYNYLVNLAVKKIIIVVLSAIATLASVVTLIILNLKVFRSVDFAEVIANAESKAQARKAKRVQIKSERAEADKQAKIQELEKQLEELKSNE